MSEEVKTVPLPISAMRITRQAQIANNDVLAFEFAIEQTAHEDDVREHMQRIDAILKREKARSELPSRREHLDVIRTMPGQIHAAIEYIRRSKAQARSEIIAGHQAHNKRNPGALSAQEERKLEEFDRQIAEQQKLLDTVPESIAGAEWEVARREAVLDGKPEPPRPEAMPGAALGMKGRAATGLAEAAD